MKRFLIAAVFPLFLLCNLQFIGAQEPAEPAVTSSLDTNKDGKVDEAETAAATNADADVGTTIGEGAEAVSTITDAWKNRDKLPIGTLWAIILGTIFKVLLSLMKVVGKNVAWFKTQDGKRVIKYSTLGLGALAALMANLVFGMHWLEAAQLLLSGPIAVAIHEYTKDSKDPDANVPEATG